MPNLSLKSSPSRPVALGAGARDLRVRGVTKRFGATEVLKGADLAVPAGSVTALLGTSGCGKRHS